MEAEPGRTSLQALLSAALFFPPRQSYELQSRQPQFGFSQSYKQHNGPTEPAETSRSPLKTQRSSSYLVVDVTVCKHRVKILDTFLSIPVVVILQAFLYCSHVHRRFNYLIIILQRAERHRDKDGILIVPKLSSKRIQPPSPGHCLSHLLGKPHRTQQGKVSGER